MISLDMSFLQHQAWDNFLLKSFKFNQKQLSHENLACQVDIAAYRI